jgi:hypothetical protein
MFQTTESNFYGPWALRIKIYIKLLHFWTFVFFDTDQTRFKTFPLPTGFFLSPTFFGFGVNVFFRIPRGRPRFYRI